MVSEVFHNFFLETHLPLLFVERYGNWNTVKKGMPIPVGIPPNIFLGLLKQTFKEALISAAFSQLPV